MQNGARVLSGDKMTETKNEYKNINSSNDLFAMFLIMLNYQIE